MTRARRRSRTVAHAVAIAATVAVVVIVELLIRAGVINPFIVSLPSLILASIPRIVTEEHVLQRFWQTTQEIAWASLLLALVGIGSGVLLYRVRLLRMACEDWVVGVAGPPARPRVRVFI